MCAMHANLSNGIKDLQCLQYSSDMTQMECQQLESQNLQLYVNGGECIYSFFRGFPCVKSLVLLLVSRSSKATVTTTSKRTTPSTRPSTPVSFGCSRGRGTSASPCGLSCWVAMSSSVLNPPPPLCSSACPASQIHPTQLSALGGDKH